MKSVDLKPNTKEFLACHLGNEFWSKGISSQTFFTSESGETLGVFILTGGCYGTLSEQKHVVKNLYSKGSFKPDHYFF